MEFVPFPKIARLSRNCVITEKIDGTNASIYIGERCGAKDDANIIAAHPDDGALIMKVGSRTRWITPIDDNYGFAKWVNDHIGELWGLGIGHHFGEWWGKGIQRNYGLTEKRFSLFNTHRWSDAAVRPACCYVVPTLYEGAFTTYWVTHALAGLNSHGSSAVPGFMKPEGVIVYHQAGGGYFKKTLDKDDEWKGKK